MTIAYWCILVAIILPYALIRGASSLTKIQRDNELPREFYEKVSGQAQRAVWAHLNGFEANIGFIAGVLIASLVHAPQGRIDLLAIIFIIARILYSIFYVTGKGTLRTLCFTIGFACTIGLFVISALVK